MLSIQTTSDKYSFIFEPGYFGVTPGSEYLIIQSPFGKDGAQISWDIRLPPFTH